MLWVLKVSFIGESSNGKTAVSKTVPKGYRCSSRRFPASPKGHIMILEAYEFHLGVCSKSRHGRKCKMRSYVGLAGDNIELSKIYLGKEIRL